MSFGKYLIPAIIPRRVAPDSSVLSVPADPQRAGTGVQPDHRTGGIDQQLQGVDLSLDAFRQAVVEGKHPDGEELSANMPHWEMSDEDLTALLEYLKLLP